MHMNLNNGQNKCISSCASTILVAHARVVVVDRDVVGFLSCVYEKKTITF
jgi:hypothetical protein